MMYQNNLVACVKVNGQILRESGDTVALPFGSEYSILIKNLNSVRAQVAVSIDGKNAVGRIVIGPNSSVELERFMQNGNLNAGNRFKFIERSAAVEAHRGIGSDDGLIRVEGWKEHVVPVIDVPVVRHHYYDHWHPRYHPFYPPSPFQPWITWGVNTSQTTCNAGSGPTEVKSSYLRSASFVGAMTANAAGSASQSTANNDAGITVGGSQSRQSFVTVPGFSLESTSSVIVLHLRGVSGKVKVTKPLTVKAKAKCDTCGKSNKGDAQFCSKCGAALVAFA